MYTHNQINTMLQSISQGEWEAYDHEAEEVPELIEDRTEGGAWWLKGPQFVDFGDYSCFSEADAQFIASAPGIVRQLLGEIDHLRSLHEALTKAEKLANETGNAVIVTQRKPDGKP